MDPRSEWALGEFRDAPIELRLLDRGGAGTVEKYFSGAGEGGAEEDGRSQGGTTAGGRVVSSSRRVAYQGECLAGVLVVKFDGENGEPSFPVTVSAIAYSIVLRAEELLCTRVPVSLLRVWLTHSSSWRFHSMKP